MFDIHFHFHDLRIKYNNFQQQKNKIQTDYNNSKIIGMCDKASQIFSLKSNLISQIKGGSINLHNQKINQHIRLRSVCFSNVLQTIRKEAAKGKEQIKNQIQRQKENQGIFVEAYNFKGGDDEGRGRQSAKVGGLGSRSFLIRSCNMRKNNTNTNKPQQNKPQNLCLCLNLQKYNINNVRQFTNKTKYRLRQKYNNSPTLMLIIPQYMLSQPPSSQLLKLMQLMILNQIQIFVVVVEKKQDKNNISHFLQAYSKFCNFVYLRQFVDSQKEHFIDLADFIEFQNNISNVVTFVGVSGFFNWFVVPYLNRNNHDQHHSSQTYKQQVDDALSFDSYGTEYDPYYNIFETLQDRQPDKSVKIAFLKTLSLETIKNISITGSLVKIEVRNTSRKVRMTQSEYPLRQQVKLMCSLVSQAQIRSYRQLLPLQPLQDKLIQYTKVLKTEKQHPMTSKSPAQSPSPGIWNGVGQNKGKQYRRSLTSKSPYQLINELIRNNQHIHKQINQYIQHSSTRPIFNDVIQCDNVRMYVLE